MSGGDYETILTEVETWDSLTAWAHEVGIIMRDGKITDIFQEERRSVHSRSFGTEDVRTFVAYTSPFDLVFWLNDPDDSSDPDEGMAFDNPIRTADSQPVTGSIGITFSVIPDMADLLLRLLGPRKTITRVDVANAIWVELQAKALALDLHQHTAGELSSNQDLLKSIQGSLERELYLTLSGYGLQLDSYYVNWGLTRQERESVRQLRNRSSAQHVLETRTRETGDELARAPATLPGPDVTPRGHVGQGRPLKQPSSEAYWVYEDDPTNRARVHKATCGYCNQGRGLHGSRLPDNRWHGPFLTREEAYSRLRATGRSNADGCKVCNP